MEQTESKETEKSKPSNYQQRQNTFQQKKRSFYFRKKVCRICQQDIPGGIEYKNIALLKRFTTEKGKIVPRRLSGACAKHQRMLTRAIKQARSIALLPFSQQ